MMLKRLKTKQKKLGNINKQLIIRLVKRNKGYYDIVMARRKSKPTSKLNKMGAYQIIKNEREKYTVLKIDYKQIKSAISSGVKLHSSFVKVIFN